ncbi:hypothetical protein ACNKHN_23585 [Shigella flexneri]
MSISANCSACGYSVEHSVEGGRSRYGAFAGSKTGTLSMTIQAMLRGGRSDHADSDYIGYEHVMEAGTYAKASARCDEREESLPQMLWSLSKPA